MVLTVTIDKPITTPSSFSPAGNTDVLAYCKINHILLPLMQFRCTRPAYGSVGSFSLQTTWEALNTAGIDLYKMGKATLAQIPVDIYTQTSQGGPYHLFGGELDKVEVDYDEDVVTITGRDWAGLLVDKRAMIAAQVVPGGQEQPSLGSGCPPAQGSAAGTKLAQIGAPAATSYPSPNLLSINLITKTPSQIAYSIAKFNGLKPEVYTYAQEPTMQDIGGAAHAGLSEPHTEWSILQFCARLLQWVAYVTPSRSLYFGPPPAYPPKTFYWRSSDSMHTPINDFHLTYNPRQNGSFLVLVVSYNNVTTERTAAAVGVVQGGDTNILQAFPTIKMLTNKWFIGSSGATSDAHSLAAYFSNLGKPIYLFKYPRANAEQVQQHAFTKALEIARRELISEFQINGEPIEPLQTFTIESDHLESFAGTKYYINSVEHSFDMDDGWYTHLHAWTQGATVPGEKPYLLIGVGAGGVPAAGEVSLMGDANG